MRSIAIMPALAALLAAAELPATVLVPPDDPRETETAGETAEGEKPEGEATGERDNSAGDDTTRERTLPDPQIEPADDATDSGRKDADEGRQEEASELPDPATAEDQPPEPIDEAVLARCELELRALGAVFERHDTIDGDGACGVYQPYNLREAAPGVIVKPDTELTCAAALATARWVRDEVIPATRALGEDAELSEIIHASTYVCRSRNNQPAAKISEHARGAAIDVSSFDFDGHDPIPVVPRAGMGTIEEAFQRSVRAGACMHFTTVLGPGSDEYHDNHLHLDLAERGGGYRLCQ